MISRKNKGEIEIGNIDNNKERGTKGITFVALVVTIVVLLILAGITLTYVFGDNSVFKQATDAKLQTEIARAREKIEMVLSEAKIPKSMDSQYNENEYLEEFVLSRISNTEVLENVIITDGYAFVLDRSVPKIGEYLGKKEELVFPTVSVSEAVLEEDTKSATFTIIANEETKGIDRIEIWLSGVKLETIQCNNEKIVTKPYTVTRNGVYTIKVYADLSARATTNVEGIVPKVEFSPNGNIEWKKQHSTKIMVRETEDRIKSLKYKWTTDGVITPTEDEFAEDCSSNKSIIGKDITGTYYLWILVETETGKKNICGSNGFNFDNTAPTVKLESTPVSKTSFKLTATASDNHSGIASYKFYVGGNVVKTMETNEGTATFEVLDIQMGDGYECCVSVMDSVGMESRNTCDGRTLMYIWQKYYVKATKTYGETRIHKDWVKRVWIFRERFTIWIHFSV